MKHTFLCICTFIALLVIASPVSAFTIKTLDIYAQDNTDAIIKVNYDLNWIESTAVFAQVVDPGEELRNAIESNTGKTVDDVIVTNNHIEATIRDFIYQEPAGTIVPSLSFDRAESVLKQFWFSPMLTIDLSPDITTIIFTDNQKVEYKNMLTIPETTHICIK